MFSRVGNSPSLLHHNYHSCRSNRRSSFGETTRHIVLSRVRASSPKQDGALDVHMRKTENARSRQKQARSHSFNEVRLKLNRPSLQRLGLDPKRGSSGMSTTGGCQDLGLLKSPGYRPRSVSEGVVEPNEISNRLLGGLIARHTQPTQAKDTIRVSQSAMLALFAIAIAILAMIAKAEAARSIEMEQHPQRLASSSGTYANIIGLGTLYSGNLGLLPRERDLNGTEIEKDRAFPGSSEDHICRH